MIKYDQMCFQRRKAYNMRCPLCSFPDSRVLDSRPVEEGTSIKRRRECISCGKRFTTYEVVDTVPIAVIKRDGHREFFDKHKLARGIKIACQKRAVDAEAIALSIEQELMNAIITEISSKDIGEMVLSRLKEKDIVAYIRFASIYRDFQDIDSFTEELKSLSKRPRRKLSAKEDK